MKGPALRPPLPAPLSHEGIPFILDCSVGFSPPSAQVIAAIAAALHETLPPGDLFVDASGNVHARAVRASAHAASLWYQAGLLAGIERSAL